MIEKRKYITKVIPSAILLLMFIAGLTILNGCGIGEKTEKKLFDAMKNNGFLDLNCEYEDYDEVRSVDQSPVPAVITYYDYSQNGITYTLDYRSRIVGEDDAVYQVRLTIETDDASETTLYYFEKDSFAFREKN